MYLVYLHIAVMFSAVALAFGGELILNRLAGTRNVIAIRTGFASAAPVMRFVPMLFGLGALLGVAAALFGQFDPLAPWLIAAYILFVIAAVVGARAGVWARSVGMAAAASPVEAPSPELEAAISDRTHEIMRWADYLIILVLLFLMVFKPGA